MEKIKTALKYAAYAVGGFIYMWVMLWFLLSLDVLFTP